MKAATLLGRGWKYGTVEVRFSNKVETAAHATMILRSKKVTLLLTYKGK